MDKILQSVTSFGDISNEAKNAESSKSDSDIAKKGKREKQKGGRGAQMRCLVGL